MQCLLLSVGICTVKRSQHPCMCLCFTAVLVMQVEDLLDLFLGVGAPWPPETRQARVESPAYVEDASTRPYTIDTVPHPRLEAHSPYTARYVVQVCTYFFPCVAISCKLSVVVAHFQGCMIGYPAALAMFPCQYMYACHTPCRSRYSSRSPVRDAYRRHADEGRHRRTPEVELPRNLRRREEYR